MKYIPLTLALSLAASAAWANDNPANDQVAALGPQYPGFSFFRALTRSTDGEAMASRRELAKLNAQATAMSAQMNEQLEAQIQRALEERLQATFE